MASPASLVSPCVADMTPQHHCKYTATIHPLPGVYLGGIPLSRAPQIFRRNTRFALTGIRPDYQFLLLIFAAIWGSDFRDNFITLTRLFKQAKQIRIPFMAMFKVNICPPNEVH